MGYIRCRWYVNVRFLVIPSTRVCQIVVTYGPFFYFISCCCYPYKWIFAYFLRILHPLTQAHPWMFPEKFVRERSLDIFKKFFTQNCDMCWSLSLSPNFPPTFHPHVIPECRLNLFVVHIFCCYYLFLACLTNLPHIVCRTTTKKA